MAMIGYVSRSIRFRLPSSSLRDSLTESRELRLHALPLQKRRGERGNPWKSVDLGCIRVEDWPNKVEEKRKVLRSDDLSLSQFRFAIIHPNLQMNALQAALSDLPLGKSIRELRYESEPPRDLRWLSSSALWERIGFRWLVPRLGDSILP